MSGQIGDFVLATAGGAGDIQKSPESSETVNTVVQAAPAEAEPTPPAPPSPAAPVVAESSPIHPPEKNPSRLYVNHSPAEALVSVLSMETEFRQGMKLDPGKYHIEVSAKDHVAQRRWIDIDEGKSVELEIDLERRPAEPVVAARPAAPSPPPRTKEEKPEQKAAAAPVPEGPPVVIADPEIAKMADMLRERSPVTQREAAKLIVRHHPGQPQLVEVAKRELEKGYNTRLDNKFHVDSMAWLCKIIGVSGDSSYGPFLEEVARQSKSKKIRRYASKNADLLI
jgi:hypothetical protein